MKKIPLTRNQEALVDDADYDWLSEWTWYAQWNTHTKSFYAVRWEAGLMIWMHREILGLPRGGSLYGDHKDHDTLNNARCNLRAVTGSENQWNRRGVKGYTWHKASGKYMAQIGIGGGVTKCLGYFDDPNEAHAAYVAAKAEYHKINAE